ncbi:hypothetical protein SAMN05421774_10861 [Gemmobacter megaterium]|uniref:Uncharacterized protein n=1 Tax=Gemmobacter megaterium TaxID=1086013 RepID=A0A1N7QAV3_9RHOB|nr:hypothetical protein [Gemmobacter megaterium]GGE24284.1 hypothetical protein GCM10011345_32840 [Gemmobacter megaterium]SIT19992.1 hypothetical protein SAMN05421774_10861 [Gemmobacter megaterium]
MKITFEGFAGEIPKLNPAYLPPQNAAAVSNAKLTNGDLAPMRGNAQATVLGAVAQRIHLHGSTWLGWNHDADAAAGPVAQDRLYITRGAAGAPQMLYSGVYYGLALPAPNETPGVTAPAIAERETLATDGAARSFTHDGEKWVSAAATIPVTLHASGADLVAGTVNIANPKSANKRLVACLPAAPTGGDCVGVVNEGTGIVRVHRNGRAIVGRAGDISLDGAGQRLALLFNGTAWIAILIAPPGTILTPPTSEDSTYAHAAAAGQNISVNGARGVAVSLPATSGLPAGSTVSVERKGAAAVTVNAPGASFFGGGASFTISAQGDRHAFIWTGTNWRVLKIGGAFDDSYLSTAADAALETMKVRRFLTTSAPETIIFSMPPSGSVGDTIDVGVLGDRRAVILPMGTQINGAALPATIYPGGACTRFTYSGSEWITTASTYRAVTRDTSATSGETIIAVTSDQAVAISLPSAANDPVRIKRIGAMEVEVFGMAGDLTTETVLYAYTYVTSLGEESQPSLASAPIDAHDNQIVTVTMSAAAPAGRLITHKRVYRSVTSAAGATEFFFVDEVPAATTIYTHDPTVKPPQEVMPSTDFDPPPADLAGIIAMPNGIMAAFSGRKVCFSEPYQPHAWPEKYVLTVSDQIVGLAAFGTSLAILTTATPYVAQGLHPDSMALTRMEVSLPCLSKAGIVDLGHFAVYPSTEGLVQISQSGASVVSQALWDVDQWRQIAPATIHAAASRGRYAMSYQPIGSANRQLAYVDVSGQQPYLVPAAPVGLTSLIHHRETGRLFALQADRLTVVSVDDPSEQIGTYLWRSKPMRLPGPVNFGCIMVDAKPLAGAVPALDFKVWADGNLIRETSGASAFGRIERLPPVLATEWQVEVAGNVSTTRIVLAGVPDEVWQ